MALSELTSRKAVLKALAEYDEIGEEAFLKKYKRDHSRTIFLIHDGKRYASKAVFAAAYEYQHKKPIGKFTGGKVHIVPVLEKLNFQFEVDESSGKPWSEAENKAIVTDYFGMLAKEVAGVAYSKTEHRNQLFQKLNSRSRGAVEWKHQNISFVLEEQGYPRIQGYKMRPNVQESLRASVTEYLNEHPDAFSTAPKQLPSLPESPFVPAPKGRTPKKGRSRPPMKVDYVELAAQNNELGLAGEKWLLEVLKAGLVENGHFELAAQVKWVSEADDTRGFDIEGFDESGTKVCIEVKTTNGPIGTPFFVSANEVAVSKAIPETYRLYRIFNFNKEPKCYVLSGAIDATCELEAAVWRARPV